MPPFLLCVLDGFGRRAPAADNAATAARTPCLDELARVCPQAQLQASEGYVGLPDGQIGNSEVGHMNLGAGRVVFQDLPLIDRAIVSGELATKPALGELIAKLKASGGTCHLMGLASPGGVHAHDRHIEALATIVGRAGVPVAVHAFLDGRDVPPQSAADQIVALERRLQVLPNVRLATLCGRFYAMDRDKRWERVARAYALVTDGQGTAATDPVAAIRASYAQKVTDEFVEPVTLNGYAGMKDGDGVLFANFRADRAREILTALLDPAFDGFTRARVVTFAAAVGMVAYSDPLAARMGVLFPPRTLANGLGEVLAARGLHQLRVAETEKYPHVTFFFNGGREEPFEGEERVMVPSPKVKTYDLQPEMSAFEVTEKVEEAVASGRFDFILLNFANADMVGHTGSLPAAIKAVEALDTCLARVLAAVRAAGGCALVTADHGNAEQMVDPATGGPHTAHTLNPVPLFLVNGPAGMGLRDGVLADVAPTVLALMGIAPPPEMTGASLLTPVG
jgi:2,3-bisphosphoglycerate-independent phosphoglycerate mutase